MTTQEAQKHEDILMDMYKLHAYIPNDAEGNPLTPFGNFSAGYEAATTEANKRIAELKQDRNDLNYKCMERLHKIEELQDSNNHLREALEEIKSLSVQSDDGYLAQDIAEKALQATPAESLQAHDDEVIEKCAKVCEGKLSGAHKEHEWWYGFKAGMKQASDAIRALKVYVNE